MSDQPVVDTVVVEDATKEPRRRNWLWIAGLFALLLLIIACVLVTPWVYRQASGLVSGGVATPVPSIRIPGKGSQLDHSGGLPFAKVIVHDNESANARGYFDRTVENTADPKVIGMDGQFSVPSGWFVERDFSAAGNKFVDYMTVKPPTGVTIAQIREWATEQGLVEGTSYQVTSVIVDKDGQECSIQGIADNRVRVNIYVGQNWSAQYCPVE